MFNAITAGTGDPSSAGTGAIVSLAGGLLSATNTTIQSDGNLVRIGDGALVFSSTPNPLVTFSGGSFVGAPVGSVQGGSLLRMFSQAGRDGSFLFLSGPYLSAANAEFNVQDHVGFNIADGSVILSTTTAPFASFTGGSIASPASNFIAVHSQSSFTTPGQPTTTGNGEPSEVELAGSLLDVRGTRITSGGLRPGVSFMFMGDSSTVVSVGSAPLLSFDAATLDLNGSLLSLRRSNSSSEPTTLALAGPLFAASHGTRVDTTTAGVGTGACCAGFFMAQGSLLTGAGTEALIQLSNSTFAAGDPVRSGGNFFSLNDTGAAAGEANQLVAPAHLSLDGPLVSASDSSISTLFHLLSVARSVVVGTTPDALIQLSGATLTIGGQNPFTPETVPSGRLVNVASGATGGASANEAFLGVAGPLLSATASTLTLATDAVGVFNGATLTSTTAAPLLQLNSTTLNAGAPSRFGAILNIGGTGGPSGAQFSTVTLSGAVLSATDSSVTASGGLLNISPGGQLTVAGGTAPLFSLTGGNYDFRNDGNFTAVQLGGRSAAATGTETVNGVTLTLATDQPLRYRGPLFQTSGTAGSAHRPFSMDFALYEATAPILGLKANSQLFSATDLVSVSSRSKLTSLGSLVTLDASTLSLATGSLFNVSGGSLLRVTGDLLALSNGSTVTLNGLGNGFLLNASGGSVVTISGALASFGGAGNRIVVNNTVAPTTTLNVGGAAIPVSLVNGATIGQVSIAGNPIRNPGAGTISFPGNGSLIQVNGNTTRVTVSGN